MALDDDFSPSEFSNGGIDAECFNEALDNMPDVDMGDIPEEDGFSDIPEDIPEDTAVEKPHEEDIPSESNTSVSAEVPQETPITDETEGIGSEPIPEDSIDAEVLNEAMQDAPVPEEPVSETPVTGEPVSETPVTGEPVSETPVTEEPVSETPVIEEPVSETPVTEEPISETPVTEEPVSETPVTEELVSETPVTEEPISETPVTEEPISETPVTEEPVSETPVTEEPVSETPVTGEPISDTPVTEEPVSDTPVTEEVPQETSIANESDGVGPEPIPEDSVDAEMWNTALDNMFGADSTSGIEGTDNAVGTEIPENVANDATRDNNLATNAEIPEDINIDDLSEKNHAGSENIPEDVGNGADPVQRTAAPEISEDVTPVKPSDEAVGDKGNESSATASPDTNIPEKNWSEMSASEIYEATKGMSIKDAPSPDEMQAARREIEDRELANQMGVSVEEYKQRVAEAKDFAEKRTPSAMEQETDALLDKNRALSQEFQAAYHSDNLRDAPSYQNDLVETNGGKKYWDTKEAELSSYNNRMSQGIADLQKQRDLVGEERSKVNTELDIMRSDGTMHSDPNKYYEMEARRDALDRKNDELNYSIASMDSAMFDCAVQNGKDYRHQGRDLEQFESDAVISNARQIAENGIAKDSAMDAFRTSETLKNQIIPDKDAQIRQTEEAIYLQQNYQERFLQQPGMNFEKAMENDEFARSDRYLQALHEQKAGQVQERDELQDLHRRMTQDVKLQNSDDKIELINKGDGTVAYRVTHENGLHSERSSEGERHSSETKFHLAGGETKTENILGRDDNTQYGYKFSTHQHLADIERKDTFTRGKSSMENEVSIGVGNYEAEYSRGRNINSGERYTSSEVSMSVAKAKDTLCVENDGRKTELLKAEAAFHQVKAEAKFDEHGKKISLPEYKDFDPSVSIGGISTDWMKPQNLYEEVLPPEKRYDTHETMSKVEDALKGNPGEAIGSVSLRTAEETAADAKPSTPAAQVDYNDLYNRADSILQRPDATSEELSVLHSEHQKGLEEMQEQLSQLKKEDGSCFKSLQASRGGDPIEYAHREHELHEAQDRIRFQQQKIDDMKSQQNAIEERIKKLGGNTSNNK